MSLFLALFILAVTLSICKGQHENGCKVVLEDSYIEVGSDIDVVYQTSCKIFWTLNRGPIDESQPSTFNSSHTVLTLRNFTHQRATLEWSSATTEQVLGGAIIRTYSKPSNISCILDHEDQFEESSPDLFTCNWEHQIHPPQEINYTVLYATSSPKSQIEICKSQITNCKSINDRRIDVFDNMTITVRAKAATWEADSDPREFCPGHILKMIPPELTVTPFSDHVFVKWIRTTSSRKCRCEVKYSKAVDKGAFSVLRRTNISIGIQYGNDTIEKWDSCTNYTFSVRCAFYDIWSDWSESETVLTKLNKRDFKLWRKVAKPEGNGVRKVHVMWTEIPSTCQGTFTHTIKQTPYKEHMVGVYPNTSCGSSTCDVYVNQDAHRIKLTVLHNEILLVEDSVYVPAVGESLPQVTDIQTSTLKGVILVSWKAPIGPVTGYMIDWTHGGNQYYWEERNYTNTTLSDHEQPYDITVTPLFGDKTGQGTQALQICSRVGDPGHVTIHVQPNAKSALVSWNVTSRACSGVVVNYTIFYSVQKGPQLNVTVDGTKQSKYLKDLKPDTHYSIHVNATALTGTTKSSERLFKTHRFDPQLIIPVIVCGIIVILLVLPLGVCCAVRWKKYKEKPLPNPAFSSLAAWPAPSHQEGTCPFQPFNNPSESVCDRVYTEETQRTATSPLDTGCDGIPPCDQTGEYVDPAMCLVPVDPVEPVETPHLSSPDDSTALLPSENSPYRSQASAENSASRSNKQYQHVPVKQTEKIAPATVYVTWDMLQQSQGR